MSPEGISLVPNIGALKTGYTGTYEIVAPSVFHVNGDVQRGATVLVKHRCENGVSIHYAPATCHRECTGQPGKLHIHIDVILTGNDLIAAALAELPSDLRSLVEAHFFDGDSVYKIQRHRRMKRREIDTGITKALERIRAYMLHRDVQAVNDLI